MNFIAALKHAMIGYGIRRKEWNKDAILHLRDNELLWLADDGECRIMEVIYADRGVDLVVEDLQALDWEVI